MYYVKSKFNYHGPFSSLKEAIKVTMKENGEVCKTTSKVVIRALKTRNQGAIYMASLVKRFGYTNYWHIVKIDDVIENGKWIPAPFMVFPSGARGRAFLTSFW